MRGESPLGARFPLVVAGAAVGETNRDVAAGYETLTAVEGD